MKENLEYEFAHFGIKVSNLENSIDFYENNFDFKEIRKVDKPHLELRLAMLELNDSFLELIQPYETKIIARKNEKYEIKNGKLRQKKDSKDSLTSILQKSNSHIAIATDAMHSTYLKLKSNKVELLTDFNEKYFFCSDPDGTLIEVKQR